MQIIFILGIPLALALAALLLRRQKTIGLLNCAGYLLMLVQSVSLLRQIVLSGKTISLFGFICLDSLSAFFILVTAVVSFAAALYSIGYINNDLASARISEKKARAYYLLFNLFCCSMFFVPALDNLGMLWVAIEMTTLVSAFLVGFYNTKHSVEAAWKYIIICSVGIILALLGTILFSYAFSISGISKSLNWSEITPFANTLDKNILKFAFLFILVGYGTKAGFAPMHTWLPDAYSQAVSPISALLSGVLSNAAVYAIFRFGIIVIDGVGIAYFSKLMLLFGVISLVISGGFMLVQKDLKRLLAYSSIEHIGIIAIGLGLASPLALCGALAHIFNHAVTKSLMFFGTGNIVNLYQKHNLNAIRGVLKAMPFTGVMLLLGVFALCGFPPFSLFISEMIILIAAFGANAYLIAGLLLLFLSIVFGAFIYHFGKMLYGNLPKGMAVTGQCLSGKIAFLFLFLLICAPGIGLLFMQKDLIWFVQNLFPR
jgi:hydrogenase-4 component F